MVIGLLFIALDIMDYREEVFWGILIIGFGFLIWKSNSVRYNTKW